MEQDEEEIATQPEDGGEKKGWLYRLQHKWQVKNVLQVILILCTFALGGSLCGFLGRRIMPLVGVDHKVLKVVVYILLVTVLWPACVLLISIPFGQFRFFVHYLRKLGSRIAGRKPNKE